MNSTVEVSGEPKLEGMSELRSEEIGVLGAHRTLANDVGSPVAAYGVHGRS